jgi:hypothetical protein
MFFKEFAIHINLSMGETADQYKQFIKQMHKLAFQSSHR